MHTKNTLLLLVGGAAVVCIMSVGLVSFPPVETTDVLTGPSVDEVAEGVQITQRLRTGSPAANLASDADAADPGEQSDARDILTTRTLNPDEDMDPDHFEPNPLHQMGLDLRNHPADLAKLLEQLKTETDPEKIRLLAQLIAENAEAAGLDLPIKDLLELAGSDDIVKRQAALMILSTSSEITPEMISTVSGMARTDGDRDTRLMAIKAMGDWMQTDPTLGEQLSMELISARDASTDVNVRGYAIQTIGDQKHGLPESMIAPMVSSLRREVDAGNRSLAALALSNVEPAGKPAAVKNLEAAYQREMDLNARRNLITMIMRTAGKDAPGILQNLPISDPLLRQDINDYVEIINSGETDVNRIYDIKNQRDGDRGTDIIYE